MKVLVIGGGLLGVCTAYFLRKIGCEVTVLERRSGPGQETSFANGALLTPSMAEPWNSPGSWRVLLASLGRSDTALKLRWSALPSLAGWGITFLKNSGLRALERSTRSNLHLALYSLRMMEDLRNEVDLNYGRAATGTLRVFRDGVALEQASRAADGLVSYGLTWKQLSSREVVELQPALAPIADAIKGAIHYEVDEIGDAHRFCIALAEYARQCGVEFRFGTSVRSIDIQSGRVAAVNTDNGRYVSDAYVVAAGSYSEPLVSGLGISLPVRPAKGYSITFKSPPDLKGFRVPVVDDALHAAVVPVGDAIRVAGTAEFAGYDTTLPRARVRNLVSLISKIFPSVPFDTAAGKAWCGLRPMSADGVPIVGPTPIPNLYVNTGHGHLGWTMAAGSGRLLADLVAGNPTGVDPSAYRLERFQCS